MSHKEENQVINFLCIPVLKTSQIFLESCKRPPQIPDCPE